MIICRKEVFFKLYGGGYGNLLSLFKDAFKERVENGIYFPVYNLNEEELIQELGGMITLVAMDEVNHNLLGTGSLEILKNKNGGLFAFIKHVGVASSAKHQGIGSKLMQELIRIAKDSHCDYIRSGTSTKAKSSARWHAKNSFKKVGLVAAYGRNYYSYVYRLQLTPNSKYNSSWYCYMQYMKWNIWVRLTRKQGGELTQFGKLIQKK